MEWALTGTKGKEADTILIDFRPKGGPKDLLGCVVDSFSVVVQGEHRACNTCIFFYIFSKYDWGHFKCCTVSSMDQASLFLTAIDGRGFLVQILAAVRPKVVKRTIRRRELAQSKRRCWKVRCHRRSTSAPVLTATRSRTMTLLTSTIY